MAGRGIGERKTRFPKKELLQFNKDGQIIIAKEPLHFLNPKEQS
jgi:hypothetical protein